MLIKSDFLLINANFKSMEIRQLNYFLKLAETLHFTKASEELYIAQPALSRNVKLLEAELGVELLHRNNRNVKLTEAGHYFKEEVEVLIKQFNKVINNTVAIQNGQKRSLSIGYSHSAMQTIVPLFIKRLKEHWPETKTNLYELSNSDQLAALELQELELGFAPNPEASSMLRSGVLFSENFVLILPKSHQLTAKKLKDLSVVKDENFILPPLLAANFYVSLLYAICSDAGFFPKVVHETAYTQTALKLVEAGVGITIEPKHCVNALPPSLKYIELHQVRQKMEMTMLWHVDKHKELSKFFPLIKQISKLFRG